MKASRKAGRAGNLVGRLKRELADSERALATNPNGGIGLDLIFLRPLIAFQREITRRLLGDAELDADFRRTELRTIAERHGLAMAMSLLTRRELGRLLRKPPRELEAVRALFGVVWLDRADTPATNAIDAAPAELARRRQDRKVTWMGVGP